MLHIEGPLLNRLVPRGYMYMVIFLLLFLCPSDNSEPRFKSPVISSDHALTSKQISILHLISGLRFEGTWGGLDPIDRFMGQSRVISPHFPLSDQMAKKPSIRVISIPGYPYNKRRRVVNEQTNEFIESEFLLYGSHATILFTLVMFHQY